MSEILQSDIFFFISSAAVIVVTLFFVIALFYVIAILKNIKDVSELIKKETGRLPAMYAVVGRVVSRMFGTKKKSPRGAKKGSK